jgi:ribosomal-protein-serine acetyltransferase
MLAPMRDIPSCFETERLSVRCYEPPDAAAYLEMSLRNRAHLSRYEAKNPAMSLKTLKDAEDLMRSFAAEWTSRRYFFLGAFEKGSTRFVAQVTVGPVSWELPEFQIGYFVDCGHEGRGFVTEAVTGTLRFVFEHLNAHRVRLECSDTNLRSIGVAERCAMVREGHLRQNKRHGDGSFSGTMLYAMLRSELPAVGV